MDSQRLSELRTFDEEEEVSEHDDTLDPDSGIIIKHADNTLQALRNLLPELSSSPDETLLKYALDEGLLNRKEYFSLLETVIPEELTVGTFREIFGSEGARIYERCHPSMYREAVKLGMSYFNPNKTLAEWLDEAHRDDILTQDQFYKYLMLFTSH